MEAAFATILLVGAGLLLRTLWIMLQVDPGFRVEKVIYEGRPEGSKVPPEWHAWLHHMVDEVPAPRQRYAWEKPHEPNLTGTPRAYHPPGSVLRGGHRQRATGDYEPWVPE